jgi:hypothetical protein
MLLLRLLFRRAPFALSIALSSTFDLTFAFAFAAFAAAVAFALDAGGCAPQPSTLR